MHTFNTCLDGSTSHPASTLSRFSIPLAFAMSELPHHSCTKPSVTWAAAQAHSPHENQMATASFSKFVHMQLYMRSWLYDGGTNTTTTFNTSHSPYNTAFPHHSFRQWKLHISSNYKHASITPTSTSTSKTSSATFINKSKPSLKQAFHPFGTRFDESTFDNAFAASHMPSVFATNTLRGPLWLTSPPISEGDLPPPSGS